MYQWLMSGQGQRWRYPPWVVAAPARSASQRGYRCRCKGLHFDNIL